MTTISSLASAAALSGTEPLPVDQSGATVKATVNQVKTYVNTTPAITGGSINSTPIGATTPSTGAFTSLSASGNISSTGRTLVGTTTDDGVNALQVNGSVKVSSGGGNAVIMNHTNSGIVGNPVQRNGVAKGYLGLDATDNFGLLDSAGALRASVSPSGLAVTGNISATGTIAPQQATTAGAPAYVKGAIYFDTTLNKLRVGGATAWETITSV